MMLKWFRKDKPYVCRWCSSADERYHSDDCIMSGRNYKFPYARGTCIYCGSVPNHHTDECLWNNKYKIGAQLRIKLPNDYLVSEATEMFKQSNEIAKKMADEDEAAYQIHDDGTCTNTEQRKQSKMTREEAIDKFYEALGLLKFDEAKKIKWINLHGEVHYCKEGVDPNSTSGAIWTKINKAPQVLWQNRIGTTKYFDVDLDPNRFYGDNVVWTKVTTKIKWTNIYGQVHEFEDGYDPNTSRGFWIKTKVSEVQSEPSKPSPSSIIALDLGTKHKSNMPHHDADKIINLLYKYGYKVVDSELCDIVDKRQPQNDKP